MSDTFGGYLHILVGMALVVTVIQFIRRRNDLVRLKQRYKGEFRLLSDSGHRAGNAVSKRPQNSLHRREGNYELC